MTGLPLAPDPTLREQLRRDVVYLAAELGERNDQSDTAHRALLAAAQVLEERLGAADLRVRRQLVSSHHGRAVYNVEGERRGLTHPDEIVVLGAHYDSIVGGPGANDNATGVAALLALAARLRGVRLRRTVRFVAFTNEEHPHTRRPTMGSLVYARACRARGEHITAMASLETLGCWPERGRASKDATPWTWPLPRASDFLAFVTNLRSRELGRLLSRAFRASSTVPAHHIALPGPLPLVKSSDHWSFWKQGYPAVMITDGGPLRYRHYHRPSDTVDHVGFDGLTRVVAGLLAVVLALGGPAPEVDVPSSEEARPSP